MIAIIVGTAIGTLIALAVLEFIHQERKRRRRQNAKEQRHD